MFVDVEINEILGSSLNVYAKERPNIPVAKKRRNEIIIPGRDGALTESTGEYEPTEFAIEFNYTGKAEEFHERFDRIKKWLSAENCRMILSDDAGWFYKVAYIDIGEMQRPTERIGVFRAMIKTVDGLKYLINGINEHDISEINQNPYLISKPIYKIKGEGICTITVNGKSVKANVGQNLTIDTELMIAYREDGTMNNTAITGDYESLYLPAGNLSITSTSGFDVKIIPNWRCL